MVCVQWGGMTSAAVERLCRRHVAHRRLRLGGDVSPPAAAVAERSSAATDGDLICCRGGLNAAGVRVREWDPERREWRAV